MPTEVTTLASLASEAYACFETATRPDGESFQRVRDGSPEWVTDLVRSAHYGVPDMLMFPDDWRYAAIVSSLDAITGADDIQEAAHEFADANVDAYNAERLAWLASDRNRPYYVDQAREDGLADEGTDLLEVIGAGQYVESLEVFEQVRSFLQDRLDTLDDEEGV